MISGGRIRALIQRAQYDAELRIQLFHCPEKAIEKSDLDADEARAIRTGDLSSVDLDDATLDAGRKLFTELPTIEGQTKAAAQYLLFTSQGVLATCS